MLQAGAARRTFQPRIGADLVGYFTPQLTNGLHDDIHARALVLDDGETALALCSVECCILPAPLVDVVRQRVAARCDLPPEAVHLFATHTHAAPALHEADDWHHDPLETITDAIVTAYENRQPARLGAGFGLLYSYSINRRWMNRPIDPSVGVLRVETATGEPLALLGNYANHAVVLGYDNLLISGDWPGYASRRLEAHFGGDFVALFGQGGAGDMNPLTETVRQKLKAGHPVQAIGGVTTLYGHADDPQVWNIGDRAGGTFTEAETIALAYNEEVLRVWHSIPDAMMQTDALIWIEQRIVNGARQADEPPLKVAVDLLERLKQILPDVDANNIPLEVVVIGVGPVVIYSQPGETFSEDAIAFRKASQQMGYAFPLLISYMNGWYSYLTPANAYPEGGYEVGAAESMGLSRYVQERLWETVLPVLQAHLPDERT